MVQRLRARQRLLYGAAGVGAIALSAAFVLAGFAFSGVWPGVSWAVGGALALVTLFAAWRWLRAALGGLAPATETGAGDNRGAI